MGCMESKTDPDHSPTNVRGCTDILWLVAFNIFWLFMVSNIETSILWILIWVVVHTLRLWLWSFEIAAAHRSALIENSTKSNMKFLCLTYRAIYYLHVCVITKNYGFNIHLQNSDDVSWVLIWLRGCDWIKWSDEFAYLCCMLLYHELQVLILITVLVCTSIHIHHILNSLLEWKSMPPFQKFIH